MQKILYIALAILVINCSFLYLRLNNIKEQLENTKKDLNTAINANNELNKSIEILKQRHEQELKVLENSKIEKDNIKKRVKNVKKQVFKSSETNTTKLFNTLLDGLYEQNASY
ncbi:hypothetical protein FMM54_07950 [Campylobacter sp. LR185c]|uniref:hypothetical protein n=1 Tax=Campylobacter sp. LR185c TaxID=2014525 RepID=UPI0012380BBC|nr:hypothetical protein [Campylobacter sp. LR185c]KAA6224635.1 hypothetical protein FMM54_07950 [Campylobacter sp. LR185c]KAA8603884.1 hypothetical protein CGP82_05695 [Campylobacter sp. LR185c]